jgi:non-ribosomal peptide synthetase component F
VSNTVLLNRWTASTRFISFIPPAPPENRRGQLHTTGGYLTGVYITSKWVFDLKPDDIYWCTADIGWVTGHSYIVYGPLANGATVVMYEGSPDWPDKDRFWDIVERRHVTILYTSPTAIRQFMRWGPEYPARHDLSSLRLLGTVGEPINPEAWMWYHEHIGRGALPDRRYLVADRNRDDLDHAAAWPHDDQTRFGDAAVPGHRARYSR